MILIPLLYCIHTKKLSCLKSGVQFDMNDNLYEFKYLRRISCHGKNHSHTRCEYSETIFLCYHHCSEYSLLGSKSSTTHICRIKGCGGAGCPPPPIIFERLKLPQQIIYRRKENLSESPNHQKYWENILVSRFYEQFSRNRRNLGHFRKFEKISNS